MMHISRLAVVVGAVLSLIVAPAEAAWNGYVNREAGFSFIAPGPMSARAGTWSSGIAGEREATIFTATENNIRYEVTVTNFAQSNAASANILGEAIYSYVNELRPDEVPPDEEQPDEVQLVLMDELSRVEPPGPTAVYGRHLTVDLPNGGGRATSGYYFHDGYLIRLEATVLPANGNPESGLPGRFIRSVSFSPARVDDGAIELMLLN